MLKFQLEVISLGIKASHGDTGQFFGLTFGGALGTSWILEIKLRSEYARQVPVVLSLLSHGDPFNNRDEKVCALGRCIQVVINIVK